MNQCKHTGPFGGAEPGSEGCGGDQEWPDIRANLQATCKIHWRRILGNETFLRQTRVFMMDVTETTLVKLRHKRRVWKRDVVVDSDPPPPADVSPHLDPSPSAKPSSAGGAGSNDIAALAYLLQSRNWTLRYCSIRTVQDS